MNRHQYENLVADRAAHEAEVETIDKLLAVAFEDAAKEWVKQGYNEPINDERPYDWLDEYDGFLSDERPYFGGVTTLRGQEVARLVRRAHASCCADEHYYIPVAFVVDREEFDANHEAIIAGLDETRRAAEKAERERQDAHEQDTLERLAEKHGYTLKQAVTRSPV